MTYTTGEILSRASRDLTRRAPFYAEVLFRVPQRCNLKMDACARVGMTRIDGAARVCLEINPVLMQKIAKPEHWGGILEHEALHIELDHLKRGGRGKVWNYAADFCVNQLIPEKYLPDWALLPKNFGMPNNKSMEWYYSELLKIENTLLEFMFGHDQWAKIPDLEKELIEQQIDDILDRAAASVPANQVPPSMKNRKVGKIKATTQIPWQTVLRRFLTASCCGVRGATTWSRVNRRADDIIQNGKMIPTMPGITRSSGGHILAFLDTSGSMLGTVGAMLGEVMSVQKTGLLKLTMAYGDDKVEGVSPLRTKASIPTELKSSFGGTDMKPAFELAHKLRVHGVLMFTDGWWESIPPALRHPRTLFILPPAHTRPAWGDAVVMRDRAQI